VAIEQARRNPKGHEDHLFGGKYDNPISDSGCSSHSHYSRGCFRDDRSPPPGDSPGSGFQRPDLKEVAKDEHF